MRMVLVQAGLGAGGAERVVSLIAADRCARGDEVHLFAFVGPEEPSYFPLHPGVVVHRLSDPTARIARLGVGRSVRRIARLRAELQRLRPDLVVSFLTKVNILSLLATRTLDIPTVISERNNPQAQAKHFLWRIVEPLVQNRATRLVVQTSAILETVPMPLRERAEVIANPCDAGERDATQTSGERKIVAVGRLVDQKGFDTLIEAFAKVAGAFPEWSLSIYGEGPDRARLQDRIDALRLTGAVRLRGISDTPGEWTRDAALFVLSSRYEGFPNVLIEAMAAGIPAIATRCDFGPSEIIEDSVSGLLVPVDDTEALAAAMRPLMGDGALRLALSQAGRRAVERFSTEAIMAKWDACFRQALRDHASKAPALALHAGERG